VPLSNICRDAATTTGCESLVGVDLDPGQLRAFVAVVDHGHFGRAARSLALTQQALSKRVARLEAALGPLLERGRGGVTPTAAGERLLPLARQILDLADHAVADVRGTPPPPLRVDVWGHLHPPAALMRAIAAEHPDLVVELSMRRNLGEAIGALQRHEVDLAFGNVAHLGRAVAPGLEAELIATDAIAALVNTRGELGDRDQLTPADLAHHGLWWPNPGSSPEVRAFATEYATAIGAPLFTDGTNLGLDALVDRVSSDPATIAPVAAGWPIPTGAHVRIVPIRPAPHYPWYAVWRSDAAGPALPRVLRSLRSRASRPGADAERWLPRELRSDPTGE
jgi:DNA-binding transcriptional LysR family regulator